MCTDQVLCIQASAGRVRCSSAPGHELLAPRSELRREEAREVLLQEAEDEDMADWRERRNQNDGEGNEGQEVSRGPPQRLHLCVHMQG